MSNGKVKWFNTEKGYGFIVDDNSGNDVFFHYRYIVGAKSLPEDARVQFEVTDGKRGKQAVEVKKI